MPRTYRIAFLSPGYVTERNAGGMATYISRMAQALKKLGHIPEVFTLSSQGPQVIDHEGVCVHQVHPHASGGLLGAYRSATKLPLPRSWRFSAQILSSAAQLAAALEVRERTAPFDLVQSADYCATGWFVKPLPHRRHIVRCSGARELIARFDKSDSKNMRRTYIHYEVEAVRRAELAYAPSHFVADYYSGKLNREIHVLRPPLHMEKNGDVAIPVTLPNRFFIHFGQLRPCKGTPWLLDALPLAWQSAPEMQMLLVGPVRDSALGERLTKMMKTEKRLIHLDTLPRPQMYAVLQRAAAAVLPSLVDNLPNTVIEALSLGIPVIGSDGASINELMQHGRHGEMVPMNDVSALAQAMVRAWQGQSVQPGFTWDAPIVRQMDPLQSVLALGKFSGLELVSPNDDVSS